MKSNLFSFEKNHLVDDQLYPWSKPPRTLEAFFDKIHLWWSTRYKVSMMYVPFCTVETSFKPVSESLLIPCFCWHVLTHYYTYFTHTYISIGKRFYGRNRYLACIETEKFGWEIDQVQRSAVSLYWLLVSLASHNRFKSFLNSANCLIQTQELWTRPMRYPLIQPEACKHEYIS